MEFVADYGLFVLKAATLVVAVLVVVGGIAALAQRERRSQRHGHIEVERLNDEVEAQADTLRAALLPEDEFRKLLKARRKEEKAREKQRDGKRRQVFVLDFDGDIQASAVDNLRHEITAVLAVAGKEDEVVVRIDSGGGMVTSYGLAASQLERIRRAGIRLTACIDEVAASGGYMMACVADRIVAAPFAVVGSIGVVAQIPNFHRLLRKHEVDVELHTAGEYKRTLTVFGENTDKGRAKFVEELEDAHRLFKEFVSTWRPQVDTAVVGTGEHWFAQQALAHKLVDEIATSDGFLVEAMREADVFEVRYEQRRTLAEKFGFAAAGAVDRLLVRWWGRFAARPHA